MMSDPEYENNTTSTLLAADIFYSDDGKRPVGSIECYFVLLE